MSWSTWFLLVIAMVLTGADPAGSVVLSFPPQEATRSAATVAARIDGRVMRFRAPGVVIGQVCGPFTNLSQRRRCR